MNRLIHKYPLELTYTQDIFMPVGSKILTAMVQNDTICLWAEHQPDTTLQEWRRIQIVGTGHVASPEEAIYINSVQMGVYVWHIYEINILNNKDQYNETDKD